MRKRTRLVAATAVLALVPAAVANAETGETSDSGTGKPGRCSFGDVQASVAEGFKNGLLSVQESLFRFRPGGPVLSPADPAVLDDCVISPAVFPPEIVYPNEDSLPTQVFTTNDWILGAAPVATVASDRTQAIANLEAVDVSLEIGGEGEELLTQFGVFDEQTPIYLESEWIDGEPVPWDASTQVKFAPNIIPDPLFPDERYVDAWFQVHYVFISPGELAPGEYQFKSCIPNDGWLGDNYYGPDEYPELCGFAKVEITG